MDEVTLLGLEKEYLIEAFQSIFEKKNKLLFYRTSIADAHHSYRNAST